MHTVAEFCWFIDSKKPVELKDIPPIQIKDYEFSDPKERKANDRFFKPDIHYRIM